MLQRSSRQYVMAGWLGLACLLMGTCNAYAKDIYVNNQAGNDQNSGVVQSPVYSIRKALSLASAGDAIHLLPERAVYREMVTLRNISVITFEGNNCTVSAADKLPSDPGQWEKVGEGLHRIKLKRNMSDRCILVVNGRAEMMGRTKYMINRISTIERQKGFAEAKKAVLADFPKLQDLKAGQFVWELLEDRMGWLYVKGPLDNLEWSVRTQCIYTDGKVGDITIRNLHARFALNDGFNVHGYTYNFKMFNVSAQGCFDNGISPHGACSFSVEDGEFLHNEMAVGNDFLTETRMLRCNIGYSTQEEVMFIGGKHLIEDSRIRATGPVAIRLTYNKPGPGRWMAQKEIQMSGKDPNARPEYVFKNCTVESADGQKHSIVIAKSVNVAFEKCTFKDMEFQADSAASVKVVDCTLDAKPLTLEQIEGK
ncbi:MAG: hypothetical protein A2Z25_18450 [Planctomycetes bacterium RBG_16_55_9]|nr:MAG: hypothetical protein A2Z25_18450 [Planctomycetes bacterium RBG_16_55_9]